MQSEEPLVVRVFAPRKLARDRHALQRRPILVIQLVCYLLRCILAPLLAPLAIRAKDPLRTARKKRRIAINRTPHRPSGPGVRRSMDQPQPWLARCEQCATRTVVWAQAHRTSCITVPCSGRSAGLPTVVPVRSAPVFGSKSAVSRSVAPRKTGASSLCHAHPSAAHCAGFRRHSPLRHLQRRHHGGL